MRSVWSIILEIVKADDMEHTFSSVRQLHWTELCNHQILTKRAGRLSGENTQRRVFAAHALKRPAPGRSNCRSSRQRASMTTAPKRLTRPLMCCALPAALSKCSHSYVSSRHSMLNWGFKDASPSAFESDRLLLRFLLTVRSSLPICCAKRGNSEKRPGTDSMRPQESESGLAAPRRLRLDSFKSFQRIRRC